MKIIDTSCTPEQEVISAALHVLQSGGLVVYPTETVYGIGVDATNAHAVEKLLSYKSRREGKPLSIAVSDSEMARHYVEVNATAENLYTHFLPGPITVVSMSKGAVAPGVASETGTLGIRIPDYPLVRQIIQSLGRPITSTSANISYQKRPYKVSDIFESAPQRSVGLIDLVLDAGELPRREPSTVVDTTLHQEVVLRQGDIVFSTQESFISNSSENTQKIGESLISRFKHHLGYKSVIFALQGELGAGKTEMTRGIARGLGIEDPISSPTFIIEKEYSLVFPEGAYAGKHNSKLYHLDTWRLNSSAELVDMHFHEHVDLGNVFVIEWADRVKDVLDSIKDEAVIVWVQINYCDQLEKRTISVWY